jgi:hypothetical protein
MVLGDHIYAIIYAINAYGTSLGSEAGDGIAIVYLPDAPVNLGQNVAISTAT